MSTLDLRRTETAPSLHAQSMYPKDFSEEAKTAFEGITRTASRGLRDLNKGYRTNIHRSNGNVAFLVSRLGVQEHIAAVTFDSNSSQFRLTASEDGALSREARTLINEAVETANRSLHEVSDQREEAHARIETVLVSRPTSGMFYEEQMEAHA